MNNRSKFSPSEVIEARSSDPQGGISSPSPWPLRIGSLALLIGAWALIALPDFGSIKFIISTAVLAALAGYAVAASARSQGIAVGLEKKLRLDLLVHNVELENMAMRDDLTQLFNRRYFFERLERELRTANGFGRPVGIAIIDLDSMKAINDTYGHSTGDRLLAEFGKFLLQLTRASDVPARIGGDEFAIILPNTERSEAEVMIDRLRTALDKADFLDGEASSVKIVASVGLAGFPWSAETTDELVRQADAAMYVDKQEHQRAGAEEDEIPTRYAKTQEHQSAGAKEGEIPTTTVAPVQSGTGAEVASGN